ncbi:acid sphingomyelinase-like phosphodiesterase 3b [Trichonephila clavipes]|nr:acid sphingomyelinase-like phosphodiesterase 3b [Trichonephila clavipes]
MDKNYSRRGDINNMCHEYVDKPPYNFSDRGVYGNFRCDAPPFLLYQTVNMMKSLEPNPDFILWTGDNLPHTIIPAEWDVIYGEIESITDRLRKAFPETQIIPCIGNHDLSPVNIIDPRKSSRSIYEGFLDKGGWHELLNKSDGFMEETFTRGGYYSVSISSRLRVIALNSVLWYKKNNYTARRRDPAGQLEWLENVLNESYAKHQQV